MALSGIPERGRVLEIGCGTGQATGEFARRGYRMTCLEPGPNLARIAARNLAAFPDVRIVACSFEEWTSEETGFDVVLAAQSFHLVDPEVGLPKVARALRPGGAIAICGNQPQRGGSETDRRIQEAYARHAPGLEWGCQDDTLEKRIERTGLFGPVLASRHRWRRVYSAAEYVGLMESQSPHRLLPTEQRVALLEAIREAIVSLGGSMVVEYVAWLHFAKRTPEG